MIIKTIYIAPFLQAPKVALGAGHYLSPGGGWGGGGRGGGGGRRIFWGGSVITENPKGGGSLKTVEGFRGGTTQICLENEDIEGSRKSSKVIRGITSVT